MRERGTTRGLEWKRKGDGGREKKKYVLWDMMKDQERSISKIE